MKVKRAEIPDVLLIEPKVFCDERGFFFESWNQRTFRSLGLDLDFVQDNHSKSQRNVLRGMHFQIRHPQGKLVRAVSGSVFDVAVDLRRSSPTFARWVGFSIGRVPERRSWRKKTAWAARWIAWRHLSKKGRILRLRLSSARCAHYQYRQMREADESLDRRLSYLAIDII